MIKKIVNLFLVSYIYENLSNLRWNISKPSNQAQTILDFCMASSMYALACPKEFGKRLMLTILRDNDQKIVNFVYGILHI